MKASAVHAEHGLLRQGEAGKDGSRRQFKQEAATGPEADRAPRCAQLPRQLPNDRGPGWEAAASGEDKGRAEPLRH